ncbi:MAG: glycosyltransferase family 2 protein [Lachnospiraceae bacterium]|nr:glycosyltransferase family 2 protein [Lachnospiraceae bacterium]
MDKNRCKSNTGLVSIVVPVYNVEHFIETTIRKVQEQTWQNWELLLVNDCSTDETLEKIHTFLSDDRVQLIQQTMNQGAARARNRGIQEARGRYITFLDADDLWEPRKLEEQIAFMEEKKAAFSFLSYEFADAQGIGNGRIAHVPGSLTYKEALKNTIIFTSTVMFDMERISKEEIMMPEVKSEDTATWWRILRSGYTAYGLDEVLVRYRRPAKSLSSNKLEAVKRVWNLYRRVEKLSLGYSAYNFIYYAIRTTLRRL